MDEFKTEEIGRRLASVVLASGELGRPYLLPPGDTRRTAQNIARSVHEIDDGSRFLADIKKRNLEVEPTTGEELDRLSKQVMAQPPEVIERVKKLMGK